MSNRVSRVIALMGIGAVLAIGGAGIAQANPDNGAQHKHGDDACKKLKGKKRRNCERKHHHNHKHDQSQNQNR